MKHADTVLQPSEIVCLEYKDSRLYAEVIQLSQWRQVAWVRPLALIATSHEAQELMDWSETTGQGDRVFYDLRQGADLLWPTSLIRRALDTEVMPIFTQLHGPEKPAKDAKEVRQKLNYFVREVWRAYPNAFQASG